MNALDMPGPEFLALYVATLGAGAAAAAVVRAILRVPHGAAPRDARLTTEEAAYLQGGPRRAVDAALVSLERSGAVLVDGSKGLSAAAPVPEGGGASGDLRRSVLAHAARGGRAAELPGRCSLALAAIKARLVARGLLREDGGVASRAASAGILGAVTLLGLLKIAVGVARDRPVGFLVALVALAAIFTAVAALSDRTPLTGRGRKLLASTRRGGAALRATARANPASLSGDDMGFAFALFGAAVLVGPDVEGLRRALPPAGPPPGAPGSSDAWTSWSSCGDGSSGMGSSSSCGGGLSSCGGSSCGGGGGGCGGGGCGGCGGGGH